MFELLLSFSPQPPRAMLAAGPGARCATERRCCVGSSSTLSFTVERVPARYARERGVCLAPAAGVREVMVVTCCAAGRKDGAQAALEVGMWWVDRCLSTAVQQAAGGTAVLFCCMKIVDVAVERLTLYSSEDSPLPASSAIGRMRMPRHFFGLQLFRLGELRHVQLSPSVRRLVVEVDVRSCLRWPQSEVNNFLASLQSPLRAVHVATCSVSPVKLLNKFHASLRVLYLFRRTTTVRDPTDTRVPVNIEDEEYEEEESNTSPSLTPAMDAPATAQHASQLPAAVHGVAQLSPIARTVTPQSTSTTSTTATGARSRRTRRLRLSSAAAAAPVLEELHVTSSARRSLPRWVETCTRLKHITLRNCAYNRVDSLRFARKLTSILLDGCASFVGFDCLCGFPELRSVTVKNCGLLRDLSWVPRLRGSLSYLCIHHLSPASITAFASASCLGMGLSGLEELNLSIPSLHALRSFVAHSSATLRELTLFTCMSLSGFSDLPALPALEKVVITGNCHMQNFLWLSRSPRVVEVRATQCSQLMSLTGLDALHQLRLLDVNGCQRVRTIAPLAECVSLTYLDVSHCGLLTRVSVLEKLPCLQCVLMRNCTSLVKDFGWIEACPKLVELMVPGPSWVEAARGVLRRLGRRNVVLR
ncbi:hypothetical protein CGC20_23355 [Leishmania donovani]|uniref:Hypothetical_protein_conserved n=1 Tax=Leishmania donovani TaxID=5661 RepID=A0A504Y2A9_LEIDO|nr:hypothetical protein CGC20_23355 [Leishmania donovani]VDZ42283.1 hypothetical_protein_conserved [Leishmania donovani]